MQAESQLWVPAFAGKTKGGTPLMKLLRMHFFVAAPFDGLLVLTEAQQPRRWAEYAHFGVALEFLLARRGRVRLHARNPADHGCQVKARENDA